MPIFFSHEASPFREGCQSNRISQIVRGRRPGKAKNIRKCPQMCIASMPCNSSLKKPKLDGEKSKLSEFTSAPPRMWHVCQCLGVSFNNLIGGHPYIIFITFGCLRIELVKWREIVGAAFGMLADISVKKAAAVHFSAPLLVVLWQISVTQQFPQISHSQSYQLCLHYIIVTWYQHHCRDQWRAKKKFWEFLARVAQIGNGPLNFSHQSRWWWWWRWSYQCT